MTVREQTRRRDRRGKFLSWKKSRCRQNTDVSNDRTCTVMSNYFLPTVTGIFLFVHRKIVTGPMQVFSNNISTHYLQFQLSQFNIKKSPLSEF